VSSTSSLSSSTSSCPSSPASPQLAQSLSPEQFWAKYRRHGGTEARKFRGLFASLSLSESAPLVAAATAEEPTEPLYSEIYGAVRPPLPRKNSVSKPPARPPLPAEKHSIPDISAAVASAKKQSSKSQRISVAASPEKELVDLTAERPRVKSHRSAETAGSGVRQLGKLPAR
jgi:hypothetical protein